MAKFVHLHVHTEYSLLDGLCKIPELIKKAKDLDMEALAITDHGVLYGAFQFYLKAKEVGIKPIIGVEAYMAHRSRFDKQPRVDADQHHLTLLAKNEQGYKNLMKLITRANIEGFYYKPRIDLEILKEFHEGLIALSGCLEGEIPSLIREGKKEEAQKRTKEFQEIFGKDFYFEIMSHQIKEQDLVNKELISLSRQMGIPLVATNDVHYINPEDAQAQDVLLAIQTQKLVSDKDRLTMIDSPDFYLRTPGEMEKLFSEYPDALENTLKITQECNVEIPFGSWIFPLYPIPEGETAESFLRKKTYNELPKRFPNPPPQVIKRVEYELDVITKKGFATYFLIVADIVNWAKQQGIRVGPGRGSVAGCLVAYILRITSIDPLEHNLPFERFLNPYRPTPPDIDLDYADDRRNEVLDHVIEKYGRERVAQIITFGRIEARMAVRDITRVLGLPYSVGDRLAKMIPPGAQGAEMTIEKALKLSPELAIAYEKEPETKKILDLAKKIEGVSRQFSTHAAGVVISDKDLTEYTPLQFDSKKERLITQYDMYCLDLNMSEKAIGLLKMDFLGLRNLTILEKAKNYVKEIKGIEIDISEIPLDDPKVYQMITRGDTGGVFQLESGGMRRLAKQLKPSRFSDIAAMVALFRPGPMQFIPEFIACKASANKIKYPHPDLKPILEETYGIAVYQEQCLQIANIMAGYSMGEADNLRRAIGKKKREIMEKEKIKFIEGAVKKGYQKKVAEDVFGLIERFAGYGFNKAHSTSYAMIAYQTAWMKANYPVEFMTALLTAESGDADKISLEIEECRKMGIVILPPDINFSFSGFTIEPHKASLDGLAIRFGFSAIKNVGQAAIENILKTREEGAFKSLTDFCLRVDPQKVNKKVLESLIKAGAFDCFGKRAAMLSALDKIRQKAEEELKRKIVGQRFLFETNPKEAIEVSDNLPQIEEFSKSELAALEKELLGFYLTEHPLSPLMTSILPEISHKINQLDLNEGLSLNERVRLGGIISSLRIVLTKNGSQEMAFANLEDDTGKIEVVVFPKIFSVVKTNLFKGQIVLVEGRIDLREDTISLVAEKVTSLSSFDLDKNKFDFIIKIPKGTSSQKLILLNNLLKENLGEKKGVLIFESENGSSKRLVLNFGVNFTRKLEDEINSLLKND